MLLFCVFFTRAHAGDYTYQRERGVVCTWNSKDVICTFTEAGSCLRMWQETLIGDGHSSSFTLNGWALVPTGKFIAVSPYSPAFSGENVKVSNLPVSYAAQEQTGNNNADHLTSTDFMAVTATPSNDALNFDFTHLGCIVRIACPVYETMTVDSVMVSTKSAVFVKDAVINGAEGTLTASTKDTVQVLRMKNVELADGDTLVAYVMMAPTNLKGQSLTVTVKTSVGDRVLKSKGANLLAGKCYVLDAVRDNIANVQSQARLRGESDEVMAVNITSPTAKIHDFPLDNDNVLVLDVLENGIDNVIVEQKESAIYSLCGTRLDAKSLTKGTIYIRNGKKYIVR